MDQEHLRTVIGGEAHLKVAHRAGERVLGQPALLVQELAGLAVRRGHEEAVVEALGKLLKGKN